MGELEPVAEAMTERLDRLSLHRQVLQRARGHRSGTDDLLAAYQVLRAAPDARRVLDLGCGHGTVTLLLSSLLPDDATFVCVEAQAVSADLARRNVALNGLEDRVEVLEADLRDYEPDEAFDVVTGTPPFMPVGSGVVPQDEQRAYARFEFRGGIEAYLAVAGDAGGVVSLVMDAEQDERCRRAFRDAGVHLSATTTVIPRAGRPPRYRCYLGRAPLVDDLTIVVRDEEGEPTPQWRAIRRELQVEA